jgi:hypothetical protein
LKNGVGIRGGGGNREGALSEPIRGQKELMRKRLQVI